MTFFGVEEALRLGTDAVPCRPFPARPSGGITGQLAHVITAAHAWGLPS